MTTTIETDLLDNVIWNALSARQQGLAIGDGIARRFPADVAPFIAMERPSEAGYEAMAELLAEGDQLALFTADRLNPPADRLVVHREAPLTQMVAREIAPPSGKFDVLELGLEDVPEMIALVELAKPGPYKQRTIQLGRYIGIRREGKLVAMAGERLKPEGYTEISAVCTHPDWRGYGFAHELVAIMAQHIYQSGNTPFLHTGSANTPAIALYLKLGFVLRKELWVTVIGAAE